MAGCRRTATTTTPTRPSGGCSSHLLLYHWREGKPTWWRYFDLRGKPLDDLIDDRDAIGGPRARPRPIPPLPFKRSLDYTLHVPAAGVPARAPATPTTRPPARATTSSRSTRTASSCAAATTQPPPAPGRARRRDRSIPVAVLREALMALGRVGARRRRTLRGRPRAAAARAAARSPRARSARTSTRSSPRRSASTTPSCRSRARPAPARPSAARG